MAETTHIRKLPFHLSGFASLAGETVHRKITVQRLSLPGVKVLELEAGVGYRLIRGRIELCHKDGACLWLGPGDLFGFGHWPFLAPDWKHVVAHTSCVDCLAEEDLKNLSTEAPYFVFSAMQEMLRQIAEVEKQAGMLQGVVQDDQLFALLQTLARKFGRDSEGFLNMQASNQELAQYLGVSLSTLRRGLLRLEQAGKVLRRRGRLKTIS
jgi:CRP-like cAMP-binding protein